MQPPARLVAFSVLAAFVFSPLLALVFASRLPPWAAWLASVALPLGAYNWLARPVLAWWMGRGGKELFEEATTNAFSAERMWLVTLPGRPTVLVPNLNRMAIYRAQHPDSPTGAVFVAERSFAPSEEARLALLVEQYRRSFDGDATSSLVGWVASPASVRAPSSPLLLCGTALPGPELLEVHLVEGWSDDPSTGHARALGFGVLRLPAEVGALVRPLSRAEAREATLAGPGFDGLDPAEVVVAFFPQGA